MGDMAKSLDSRLAEMRDDFAQSIGDSIYNFVEIEADSGMIYGEELGDMKFIEALTTALGAVTEEIIRSFFIDDDHEHLV